MHTGSDLTERAAERTPAAEAAAAPAAETRVARREPRLGRRPPSGRGPAALARTRTRAYRAAAALLALAVGGGIALALRPRPAAVERAVAERRPLHVTLDEDGRTRVKDRYVISAPLAGTIGRVELRAGDSLHQGEVVARLVPLAPPLLDPRTRAEAEARLAAAVATRRQAETAVARARAGAEYADRDAARQRALFAQNATSRQVLEQAELEQRSRREDLASAIFGVRVAEHEVRMARATLGRVTGGVGATEQLEVRSPVDGRVLKVLQESEGVIQAGAPILEVGDPAALEIVVDVLTSDAVAIPPAARVSIERWAGTRRSAGTSGGSSRPPSPGCPRSASRSSG
jgi:HlyD family secretion protein